MTNPFTISGRLGRAKYFWYSFAVAVVIVLVATLVNVLFITSRGPGQEDSDRSPGPVALVGGAVYILGIVLLWTVSIRRLHDLDMSGWYCLGFLIPLLNFVLGLYLLLKKGTDGPNRFGPDPLSSRPPTA